ncbi:MAG: NADH:flavin oxidoreductase/NADH oxidase [Paracoccus sp. (in: a-proteobacteria)]|uniref:NADH:flavin oxidoreductase/NADH oxidase n=1 Tax=Paracoccus sp. TaxID=267 RepID=UPI0026E0ECF5|nr:NADH:flavin oxidoreductase/NADH oxidase [Paracoccus sp. (in: a-proteobacteria)]MDO5620900.1 NADH:flavin oxidoreductase/NADH oxidase [Paracoccus sp. (in: a-proteobacteria)]
MSQLFTPFTLKDVTLRNRVAVAPMCQYSATDGFVNDWHRVHYPGIARGGAGLVIVEATAVSPEGRITPDDLGIWSDDHISGLAEIARAIKAAGAVPGIQIAHAGPKASANNPWQGDDHIPNDDPRGWQSIAPSAHVFGGGLWKQPEEMSLAEIARVQVAFAAAARRARAAGFEWLELHFAHGYLGQSFFSTHANQRSDAYGGDFEGRSRFLRETLAAVRPEWPENLPLTARFGVVEYAGDPEAELADGIRMAAALRDGGLDLLSVSIGFSTPTANVPWAEGPFMVPVAGQVRRAIGLPVASAWGLDAPAVAEGAVANGDMDLVMMARAHLANPHYTYALAQALGVERPEWATLPAPYAHWLERYRGSARV